MEIESIQFGILSDDDIVNMSACVVNKSSMAVEHGTVYDPRMGCTQNGELCKTCNGDVWSCSGHFGMIELNTPVILFHKQVVVLLKCICLNCFRILDVGKFASFDSAVAHLHGLSNCTFCSEPVPDIKFVVGDAKIQMMIRVSNKEKNVTELTPGFIKQVFDSLSDEDVDVLCLDRELVHPKNYVLTKFPVIPTCCRPKMMAGCHVSDDDLTLILVELIKANNYLGAHAAVEDPAAYSRSVDTVKIRALAYCDNSRGRVTHNTNHKPLTGIKERINCKTGLMRQSLTGKRCERSARTVLGPDPTLHLDQVVVPRSIANQLTIPEYVTPLTIDRLTELVNDNKATTIVKSHGMKINVMHARTVKGTKLMHGDTVVRMGVGDIPVMDCKMRLLETDMVRRANGTVESVRVPQTRRLNLTIGDKVERYIQDNDRLYINRQPTLHRNGMLGVRAKIQDGNTLRLNLAITKGLNADFDGDEGTVFFCVSLGSQAELEHVVNVKEHMLSAQANKPEQCLVQDSLLAAYLMTSRPQPMTRSDFEYCLFRTNKCDKYVPRTRYDARDLFEYILPADFNAEYANMCIEKGKIVSGHFDKTSLGTTARSVIRLLHMDYDNETAADFIDNMQFLTHSWLELNPFSIGIDDCLVTSSSTIDEIRQIVQKYFVEATVASRNISSTNIREAKINMTLNKAKDLGLKIAKDALAGDNKIKDTVISGSKGDFFNIAQITGLLGQQNLSNARPEPTLTNRRRTMIHYPHVIMDNEQKYESRGFIQSSFIGGLNPKEMWFHSMTGREGMINTAMKTARSGYIQRSCVKLNEDLKVAYDGTVRDAKGGVHQFAYGNMGFEPSLVTFRSDGSVLPVEFDRLCSRLNCNSTSRRRTLRVDEMEEIVDGCRWKTTIPEEIKESIWSKHERTLRRELRGVVIADDKYDEFKRIVLTKYGRALIAPGECVGIIGAQSIGEMQTQSNLNTFHTAGKLQYNGAERFEEILKMTKLLHTPMMTIYFRTKYETAGELRDAVGCSIVGLTLANVCRGGAVRDGSGWRVELKKSVMYANRLGPDRIAESLETEYGVSVEIDTSTSMMITMNNPVGTKKKRKINDDESTHDSVSKKNELTISTIMNHQLCGIEGIRAMHVDRDDSDEFYIVTEGSNLRKMLCHPLVDIKRLYTNDIWAIYECLGIAATKRFLLADVKRCVVGVNDCHTRLLVEKMTFFGRPSSITRYTMKQNAVGALSKATFEQSVDILLNAAHRCELDTLSGVSASVVAGKQIRAGTGCMDMMIDYELLERSNDDTYRDTNYETNYGTYYE